MKDICIVPAWNRPEMLYLCLTHLRRAILSSSEANPYTDVDIWVALDRPKTRLKTTYEMRQICDEFKVKYIERSDHPYHGNSYNVLESYKHAYATNAPFIFLVEEDVLVTEDFFRWHYTVHSEMALFASVAHRNLRVRPKGGVEDFVVSATDYASLGVCWRREHLAPVLHHANDLYYGNMCGYVLNFFPKSRLKAIWSEQDGLIRRVQEHDTTAMVAFPCVPRAVHIGWYGYNRNGEAARPQGSLADRIEVLRNTVYSPEQMAKLPNQFDDLEAYREPERWDHVRLKEII